MHGDYILLILIGADFTAGDVELAFPIEDCGDGAPDGRAVYMDVEHIEKDADASEGRTFGLDGDDFSIGGGYGHGTWGDDAIRVAKEVETERGEEPKGRGEPWAGDPRDQCACGGEGQRIVYAVFYDH